MSTDTDREAGTRGGGALKRGHGAAFERLEQLSDAPGAVGDLAKWVRVR